MISLGNTRKKITGGSYFTAQTAIQKDIINGCPELGVPKRNSEETGRDMELLHRSSEAILNTGAPGKRDGISMEESSARLGLGRSPAPSIQLFQTKYTNIFMK